MALAAKARAIRVHDESLSLLLVVRTAQLCVTDTCSALSQAEACRWEQRRWWDRWREAARWQQAEAAGDR